MKELIRMCDCLEIQGRWEPKVGDRVASLWGASAWSEGHIVSMHDSGAIIFVDESGEADSCNERESLLYIPSIKDVLERLGDKFRTLEYFPTTMMWQTLDEFGHDYLSDTHIKTLLMACMHLEHDKSWSGEAWVE